MKTSSGFKSDSTINVLIYYCPVHLIFSGFFWVLVDKTPKIPKDQNISCQFFLLLFAEKINFLLVNQQTFFQLKLVHIEEVKKVNKIWFKKLFGDS